MPLCPLPHLSAPLLVLHQPHQIPQRPLCALLYLCRRIYPFSVVRAREETANPVWMQLIAGLRRDEERGAEKRRGVGGGGGGGGWGRVAVGSVEKEGAGEVGFEASGDTGGPGALAVAGIYA